MNKIDEPFNPDPKKENILLGLKFLKAEERHIQDVYKLMVLRNPNMDKEQLYKKTENEILNLNDGQSYGLYVTEKDGETIGFCRYILSTKVPIERIKFPHPVGMYCMGIIVAPEFRRRRVASFMSNSRFRLIRKLGFNEVYSMVASDNLASISMHKKFGYQEIQRGAGFFIVSFDNGEGILFKNVL